MNQGGSFYFYSIIGQFKSGKNASFIIIKNNLTKEVFGAIYLNPSYPSTDIILSFAQIFENFTNDFTI